MRPAAGAEVPGDLSGVGLVSVGFTGPSRRGCGSAGVN